MPSAFQIIREQLPKFLEEPHAQDFVNTIKAVVPTTAEDVGMELAMAPVKPLRLAGAALAALAPADAEAAGAGRLIRLGAEGIGKWFDEAVGHAMRRRTHDRGEGERLYSMIQDMPHLAEVYSPSAMGEAVAFSDPGFIRGVTPGEFHDLAAPFNRNDPRIARYIEHYKDLVRTGKFDPSTAPLTFTKSYMERQAGKPYEGFESVPWLQFENIYEDMPGMSGVIIGHEGRHRAAVLSDLYGADTPMPVVMKGPDLMEIPHNIYPEGTNLDELYARQPVNLRGQRYAEGGRTRVPKTGINEETERGGRQAVAAAKGYVGAEEPSVMRPGELDAYRSGEKAAFLSSIFDLIPGTGAAKLAPALAGIIAPGRRAGKILGIEDVIKRAEDMFHSGESQQRIAEESMGALTRMRRPGYAESVFIGPEGEPRLVISNEAARIASDAPFRATPSWRYSPGYVENSIPEGESVLLSDVLFHPSLYEVSPTAANMQIRPSEGFTSLFMGPSDLMYSRADNIITLGDYQHRTYPNAARRNDPMAYLQEGLLHEAGHGMQTEAGLRGGTSDRPEALRYAVDEALAKGSYQSPQEVAKLHAMLDKIEEARATGVGSDVTDSWLYPMYHKNYGEAEARAGSEYVPGVTPYRYLKNTW